MSRLRLVSNEEVLYNQHIMDEHFHSPQKVYPTLADGVTLTAHNTAWTLGNKTEIVPVNTITSPFDIHFLNIGLASATDTYELVLYKGLAGAEIEIGRVRVIRAAAQSGTAPMPMLTAILPANTRISGALASASGGGDTLELALIYHTY